MTDYNDIYAASENALGAPYDVLMQSLTKHIPPTSRILDVGCGQGRDSLPLARAGHKVTAIDAAPAGIASLDRAAESENLDIKTEVADLLTWTTDAVFDVLLCNRILHMLSKQDRIDVFESLLKTVAIDGFVFLVDERSNMRDLKATIARAGRSFKVLHDAKGDYFIRMDQRDT